MINVSNCGRHLIIKQDNKMLEQDYSYIYF